MTHPDIDALLNTVLPFAQQMLKKHGEFFPFGATMDKRGEIVLAAGAVEQEYPLAQDIIDLLVARFREQATKGTIKGCGVCYISRVVPPNDTRKVEAISASLEHESGEAVAVFLPYHKGLFGHISYGQLFAGGLDHQVFNTAD